MFDKKLKTLTLNCEFEGNRLVLAPGKKNSGFMFLFKAGSIPKGFENSDDVASYLRTIVPGEVDYFDQKSRDSKKVYDFWVDHRSINGVDYDALTLVIIPPELSSSTDHGDTIADVIAQQLEETKPAAVGALISTQETTVEVESYMYTEDDVKEAAKLMADNLSSASLSVMLKDKPRETAMKVRCLNVLKGKVEGDEIHAQAASMAKRLEDNYWGKILENFKKNNTKLKSKEEPHIDEVPYKDPTTPPRRRRKPPTSPVVVETTEATLVPSSTPTEPVSSVPETTSEVPSTESPPKRKRTRKKSQPKEVIPMAENVEIIDISTPVKNRDGWYHWYMRDQSEEIKAGFPWKVKKGFQWELTPTTVVKANDTFVSKDDAELNKPSDKQMCYVKAVLKETTGDPYCLIDGKQVAVSTGGGTIHALKLIVDYAMSISEFDMDDGKVDPVFKKIDEGELIAQLSSKSKGRPYIDPGKLPRILAKIKQVMTLAV